MLSHYVPGDAMKVALLVPNIIGLQPWHLFCDPINSVVGEVLGFVALTVEEDCNEIAANRLIPVAGPPGIRVKPSE
jgi:hypothetical protein